MFKRGRFIIVVVVLGLLGSSFQYSVGAAAVEGGTNTSKNENQRVVTYYDADFDAMFKRLVTNWNRQQNNKEIDKQKQRKSPTERPVEKQKPVQQPQPEIVQETPAKQPTKPAKPTQSEKQEQVNQLGQLNAFEQQVFELTNQERVKNGLQPLAIDYELSRVAREKSRDMAVNRYFDHTSPVYGSPFDMMRAYGITYHAAGENIAMGQRTPAEVVNAWMNSPGHRANILNSSFTHIGVGYVEQGNHWTQQFIGK